MLVLRRRLGRGAQAALWPDLVGSPGPLLDQLPGLCAQGSRGVRDLSPLALATALLVLLVLLIFLHVLFFQQRESAVIVRIGLVPGERVELLGAHQDHGRCKIPLQAEGMQKFHVLVALLHPLRGQVRAEDLLEGRGCSPARRGELGRRPLPREVLGGDELALHGSALDLVRVVNAHKGVELREERLGKLAIGAAVADLGQPLDDLRHHEVLPIAELDVAVLVDGLHLLRGPREHDHPRRHQLAQGFRVRVAGVDAAVLRVAFQRDEGGLHRGGLEERELCYPVKVHAALDAEHREVGQEVVALHAREAREAPPLVQELEHVLVGADHQRPEQPRDAVVRQRIVLDDVDAAIGEQL
mmetsp:Transcript_42058/g.121653  ORF Transcript_42058/g.121653 Transcript_42058/m.121653 type:complete len:356 (+) Transcript_42058:1278-2345(+)